MRTRRLRRCSIGLLAINSSEHSFRVSTKLCVECDTVPINIERRSDSERLCDAHGEISLTRKPEPGNCGFLYATENQVEVVSPIGDRLFVGIVESSRTGPILPASVLLVVFESLAQTIEQMSVPHFAVFRLFQIGPKLDSGLWIEQRYQSVAIRYRAIH